MHLYLPSYETARALTILNFNFVMCVITLDLMLLNMAAKPFWGVHPAFILLVVPLLAHFTLKCDAQVEIYISMGCAAFGFAIYLLRMSCLTIQYLDFSNRSFLLRYLPDEKKIKSV
jgi:hypothetical protein